MANYRVTVTETHTYDVFLEAGDADSAKDTAYQAWENGELGYAGLEIETEVEEV